MTTQIRAASAQVRTSVNDAIKHEAAAEEAFQNGLTRIQQEHIEDAERYLAEGEREYDEAQRARVAAQVWAREWLRLVKARDAKKGAGRDPA